MSLSEELQKLADLYDDGVLTEQEFAEAKRQLLHPAPKAPERSAPDPSLGSAAERYVSFQMAMSIIGLIIFLLFFFAFWLPGFQNATGAFQSQPSVRLIMSPTPQTAR